MKQKIAYTVQILAVVMLLIFGANGFLQFMPMPPMPEAMAGYMGALFQTGFIFPIVGIVEIIVGLAFVSNKFVALMAVILMPVMINAVLAHLFLDPAGVGGSAVILLLTIIIMFNHKEQYALMMRAS